MKEGIKPYLGTIFGVYLWGGPVSNYLATVQQPPRMHCGGQLCTENAKDFVSLSNSRVHIFMFIFVCFAPQQLSCVSPESKKNTPLFVKQFPLSQINNNGEGAAIMEAHMSWGMLLRRRERGVLCCVGACMHVFILEHVRMIHTMTEKPLCWPRHRFPLTSGCFVPSSASVQRWQDTTSRTHSARDARSLWIWPVQARRGGVEGARLGSNGESCQVGRQHPFPSWI